MTARTNGPPAPSTGSFYYDYSEEFEKQIPRPLEPSIPLCPIPQRAGSTTRPMVLREETRTHLDVVTPENDSEEANEVSSKGQMTPHPLYLTT